jgi:hypothetical protein
MGREVFEYWADILRMHFPDLHKWMTGEHPHWRRKPLSRRRQPGSVKPARWRSAEPTLRQLLEASLPVMSFLQKMQRKKRVIFGDEVKKMDWACLCLVFEYHLRCELSLESEECKRRISSYYEKDDAKILREDCLKHIIEAFWGYVLDFVNGLGVSYFYHDLDRTFFGYDRCACEAAGRFTDNYLPRSFPPIPPSVQWKYRASVHLPEALKHRRNPPLEELV